MNDIFISKNLIVTEHTLTTTASRLIKPSFERSYIITNLSLNENLIKNIQHYSGTVTADTDTTASLIDVRNFNEAHIYVNGAAATGGTWEIYAMTKDDYSSGWVSTPILFTNIEVNAGSAIYYALLNKESLSNYLAFRIIPRLSLATSSITLTIGVTLKGGIGNASNNIANIAYIGSSNTVTATSGHPILPNSSLKFKLEKDAEIWGIGGNIVTNVLCKVTVL